MKPFPATVSQEKSHVRYWRSKRYFEMVQKIVGQEKKEEFLATTFHFYKSEGEGEGDERIMTFMYGLDGQMLGVNVGWNVYQDCAGILERNPQIKPADGFARIDADWLSSVLA